MVWLAEETDRGRRRGRWTTLGDPEGDSPIFAPFSLGRKLGQSPTDSKTLGSRFLQGSVGFRGEGSPGCPCFRIGYVSFWISAISGMNSAITMNPTRVPRTMINNGSIKLVRLSVRTLTSSS